MEIWDRQLGDGKQCQECKEHRAGHLVGRERMCHQPCYQATVLTDLSSDQQFVSRQSFNHLIFVLPFFYQAGQLMVVMVVNLGILLFYLIRDIFVLFGKKCKRNMKCLRLIYFGGFGFL